MGVQSLSWLAFGLFSALGSAVTLQPLDLPQHVGQKATRDNDYSMLDLLSSETFLWGGMLSPSPIFTTD